jgi:hypothetical protein
MGWMPASFSFCTAASRSSIVVGGLGDAGLREQVLAVVDAARQHRHRHAVDLAVDGERVERRVTEGGLGVRADLVGQVHRLAGVHHVRELAAAAGEEDVRRVARVQGGLELAVHVLVLDGLDADRDVRVLLLERRDGVLPERLAVTGGRVVPEGHLDLAVGVRAGVVPAPAGREAQGPHEHGGTGRQRLPSLHRSVLFVELTSRTVDAPNGADRMSFLVRG